MKWLEMIELRAIGSNREVLDSHLQQLLCQADEETNTQAITVYSHAMVHSDVSIHLIHDSTHVEQGGSPLGLRLASSLKEFDLVHHRVWIEMSVR